MIVREKAHDKNYVIKYGNLSVLTEDRSCGDIKRRGHIGSTKDASQKLSKVLKTG